jgi:hypothetical protein
MDAVATTLDGSIEPAGTIVVDLVQELAGTPVAAVLGKGLHMSSSGPPMPMGRWRMPPNMPIFAGPNRLVFSKA